MAKIIHHGRIVHTTGELPKVGSKAIDFTLTANDLSDVSLPDYKNSDVVLNIFPSIDTRVCAMSVREFNRRAASLKEAVEIGRASCRERV